MSTPYVTFPGSAGNYISTVDTNLLDADTAHLEQSIGDWVPDYQADSVTQSQDIPSLYGDYVGKIVSYATSAEIVWASTTVVIPTAGTYTLSVDMLIEASIGVSTWDFRAYPITGGVASQLAIVDGVRQRHSVTFTTTTADESVLLRIGALTQSIGNPETIYFDRVCLREGTSTTFVPSLRIVGDIDLRAYLAADDWTPAAQTVILSRATTAINRALLPLVNTDGKLRLAWTPDGSSYTQANSTVATGLANETAAEIRMTLDVDNGAAGHTAMFYVDGVQLGATVVTGGVTSIADIAAPLIIGSYISGTLNLLPGDFYWVEVRDGIDGPVVARFDAADVAKSTL